jgi:predicted nucleic acid-binding protein
VLLLAAEEGAPLLVDERKARDAAAPRGVKAFGSLRVLKRDACAGETPVGRSVKGTNFLVKKLKQAYICTRYPKKGIAVAPSVGVVEG